jgi:hypothetical protein
VSKLAGQIAAGYVERRYDDWYGGGGVSMSIRERLETGISRLEGMDEWRNPEPGVLTWRDYKIERRHTGRLALYRKDAPPWPMEVEQGSLMELKARAERDYAERVEMGEIKPELESDERR